MKTSVSCDQCRLQIASLAEATLSSGASSSLPEAVASHLENCAECRFEYSILKDIAGELRALPFHEAPPNLRLRVRAQIDREQFAAKNVRRFPLLKMPRWASFSLSGAGVAACLLFLIAQHPDKFSQSETFPETATTETATTETATTETDTNDAENASISAHKIPSKITSAPTAAPKPRAARPTQNAATLKQRFAPENGAAASQNDTSSTGNETYAAPDSTNNSTRNALSPMPLLRAPSPIQKSLSNGAARSISQNGAARLEFLPPDADRAKILRNRSVSPSSSKSANEGSVNESSVNQESARGGARDTKRGQNSPSNSNASTAPVVGSTPPQNFSAPMQGVSPTITAPAPSAPSAPQHDTTQNGSHLDGGNQLSSQSLRARKTTDAASTQNAASQNNSDQQNATAPDATAQGKAAPAAARAMSQSNSGAPADSAAAFESNATLADANATTSTRSGDARNVTPRADRTLKSSQLSLPKTKSATPNSVSFQRVRLTFTPRHDAKTARLLVQWLPLETSPQVVWRGAAHRNQPIVATFEAPRQNAKASVGNKNRSAQVSLQVPQGTSARNAWKTVESIVIDSISAIR